MVGAKLMPQNPFGLTGVAAPDLGYGGNMLADQTKMETEEQRKKRLQLLVDAKASPAVSSIFGTLGGLGGSLSGPATTRR